MKKTLQAEYISILSRLITNLLLAYAQLMNEVSVNLDRL